MSKQRLLTDPVGLLFFAIPFIVYGGSVFLAWDWEPLPPIWDWCCAGVFVALAILMAGRGVSQGERRVVPLVGLIGPVLVTLAQPRTMPPRAILFIAIAWLCWLVTAFHFLRPPPRENALVDDDDVPPPA